MEVTLGTEQNKFVQDGSHIYIYVTFNARNTNAEMKLAIKAYIVDGLAHPLVIGKNDLHKHSFIESKYLAGYEPQVSNALKDHPDVLKAMTEQFGAYKSEGHDAKTSLFLFRHLKKKELYDAFLNLTEVMDIVPGVHYALSDVTGTSQDEDLKYFEDIDLEADYKEGELPEKIEGSEEFIKNARKLNIRYKNIFSKKLRDKPADVEPFSLDIDHDKWMALPEIRQPRQQSYPKQQALQKSIIEGLEQKVLRASIATRTSPTNMVPKPEPGEFRRTIDYRMLNSCCDKIAHPLPKIAEVITNIAKSGCRFFAKIDLTQGFHQIPLAEADRIYTAFKTFQGVYEYLVMPMGIKGAPTYFQHVIQTIFEDAQHFCQVYIDDLFVYAHNEKELLEKLEEVYKRLAAKGFTVNPKKTAIGLKQIDYLGYTITQDGQMQVNETKRTELFDFPKPELHKQLKSFIGIATVFQDRLKGYSTIAKALNDYLGGYTTKRGNLKVQWTKVMDDSYEQIKELIRTMPDLNFINKDRITILRTDASDYGCGAHLVQKEILRYPTGEIKTDEKGNTLYGEDITIQFVSKAFDKTQLNWCTAEKECYGVWYACKKLSYLLEGETFTIEVDHKNLVRLKQSANQKVQRWKSYLSRFNADWVYIPGPTNVIADAFSRIVHIPDESKIFVQDLERLSCLREIILNHEDFAHPEEDEEELKNPAGNRLGRDNSSINGPGMVQQRDKPGMATTGTARVKLQKLTGCEHYHSMKETEQNEMREIMSFDEKEMLNVLNETEIETEKRMGYLKGCIRLVHNFLEGHFGINKTMKALDIVLENQANEAGLENEEDFRIKYREYSAKEKRIAVTDFIKKCAICQKAAQHDSPNTDIETTPWTGSTYEPNEQVQMDHVGPLPADKNGYTHILVIIDTCTRWCELYPVKTVTAEETAFCLGDYMLRYGPPKQWVTDRGSAFMEKSFQEIAAISGIESIRPKMANDKERVGIVERQNRNLREHLNKLMHEKYLQNDWGFAVKMVQRILNNSTHTATGVAPSKLMFGKMISPLTHIWPEKPENMKFPPEERDTFMERRLIEQEVILKYIRRNMERHDEQHKLKPVPPNEQTFLEKNTLVAYKRFDKTKQELNWTGPYLVTDRDGDFYELTSLKQDKLPFITHARNLKRYYINEGEDPREIAFQDDGIKDIAEIIQHTGDGRTTDPHTKAFQVRYKINRRTDELDWLTYSNVKDTEAFVNYCCDLKVNKPDWIGETARIYYKSKIDTCLNANTHAREQQKANKAALKEQRKQIIPIQTNGEIKTLHEEPQQQKSSAKPVKRTSHALSDQESEKKKPKLVTHKKKPVQSQFDFAIKQNSYGRNRKKNEKYANMADKNK